MATELSMAGAVRLAHEFVKWCRKHGYKPEQVSFERWCSTFRHEQDATAIWSYVPWSVPDPEPEADTGTLDLFKYRVLETSQPSLDELKEKHAGSLRFYGDDYVPERDELRLTKQQERIFAVMCDGEWRSVQEVNDELEARFGKREPEQSISRQIRYLREKVPAERRYEGGGLYRWRLRTQLKGESHAGD